MHARTIAPRAESMTRKALPWRVLAIAGFVLVAASLLGCASNDEDAPTDTMTSAGSASTSGDAAVFPEGGFGEAMAPSSGRAEEAFSPPFDRAGFDGGTNGEGNGGALQGTFNRQVIRNGSLDLVVASVDDSFERVRQVAETAGGYVAGSSFTGRDESQRAYLTLRVPAEEFGAVIAQLRELAVEVNTIATSSSDVTEEYTDLQARLRNQRAVEEQYLTLLGEAREIGDILQVQDRLSGVRYEIERVQGRLSLLDNLTSLATLEVTLSPESEAAVKPGEPGFGDRVAEAWESSLETLAELGTGVVVALVWSWWLLPVLVVALIFGRRVTARLMSRRSRVDTPESAA